MKKIETIELKLSRRGRYGWKEHIPRTDTKTFIDALDDIIDRHGPDDTGSYQVSIKVNGGFNGKKPDKGMTVVTNWKGTIRYIHKLISGISYQFESIYNAEED